MGMVVSVLCYKKNKEIGINVTVMGACYRVCPKQNNKKSRNKQNKRRTSTSA